MKIKKFAALGLMLAVIIGAATALSTPAAAAELPVAFPASSTELDYKDMPYSTEAKNQNPHGTCWAFSAVACAEADAIKNHGADKNTIDLSEWHLAYFAYHGLREGTGDSVSLSGNDPYYSLGGYDMLSTLTLSAGIGLVSEENAPYELLLKNPSAELKYESMYDCEYRIDNVILLDIANDPEAVKAAIYEYGAVTANYYSDLSYLNMGSNGTFAQYCGDSSKTADHAITIIGWDDNYSRVNFSATNGRPRGNGAWLVKNSWGTDFGFSGYFWISYYDATLTGGTAFDVVPTETYDKIYQHDGGITLQYIDSTVNDEVVNVFTSDARTSELLTAVGVSVTDRGNTNEYTLRIYSDPKYNDENGLTYGRVLHTQTGYLHGGYNNIYLNTPVELTRGTTFAVSICTDAGIMVDGDSATELISGTVYTSEAEVLGGQTYYKEGNDPWKDAAEDGTPWNARIKALTVTANTRSKPKLSALPDISTLTYGEPLSSATISGGEVVDAQTGEMLSGVWSFKEEMMIPSSDAEKVRIVFTPDDIMNYTAIEVSVMVFVDMTVEDNEKPPSDGYETEPLPEYDIHDPSDFNSPDSNDSIFDLDGDGKESDLETVIDSVLSVLAELEDILVFLLPILIGLLIIIAIALVLALPVGLSALAGLIVALIIKAFSAMTRKRDK